MRGIILVCTGTPFACRYVMMHFPGASYSRIFLMTGSSRCISRTASGLMGEGVRPTMKMFSGKYRTSGGRFKQYKIIAPQETTLPAAMSVSFQSQTLHDENIPAILFV